MKKSRIRTVAAAVRKRARLFRTGDCLGTERLSAAGLPGEERVRKAYNSVGMQAVVITFSP